ncbi:hypothetical protein FACS189475_04040 [Betaproteobacteria bacterium]|nr:hypothetical protein FACS189475_04040 [Betaproteobacteria bacterium]
MVSNIIDLTWACRNHCQDNPGLLCRQCLHYSGQLYRNRFICFVRFVYFGYTSFHDAV